MAGDASAAFCARHPGASFPLYGSRSGDTGVEIDDVLQASKLWITTDVVNLVEAAGRKLATCALYGKKEMKRVVLRRGWYTRQIDDAFDLTGPGIYEWRIDGVGVYIGKAKTLRSRISAYPRNVRHIIEGRNWHSDPTKKFRPVHLALREAYDSERPVAVTVLEVCDPSQLRERERHWIDQRKWEAAQGGLPVLNRW